MYWYCDLKCHKNCDLYISFVTVNIPIKSGWLKWLLWKFDRLHFNILLKLGSHIGWKWSRLDCNQHLLEVEASKWRCNGCQICSAPTSFPFIQYTTEARDDIIFVYAWTTWSRYYILILSFWNILTRYLILFIFLPITK